MTMRVNHRTLIPAGGLRVPAFDGRHRREFSHQGLRTLGAGAGAGHAHGSDPTRRCGVRPLFCACWLLTNSFEAFRDLTESDAFYGLRLLAFRDGDGNPGADCRVNGDDWEKGAQALRAYAKPGLRRGTSSTSNTWCYKPCSTTPGQPRNKLKVFLLPGCDDRIAGCYRGVEAPENRGIERRFHRLTQHEEPIWTGSISVLQRS
jgi:hypothetical protein